MEGQIVQPIYCIEGKQLVLLVVYNIQLYSHYKCMQHISEFEVYGDKILFHKFITIWPTNTLFIYKYLKGLIREGGEVLDT